MGTKILFLFRNLEEKKIQKEEEDWTNWLRKDMIISSTVVFPKYFIAWVLLY